MTLKNTLILLFSLFIVSGTAYAQTTVGGIGAQLGIDSAGGYRLPYIVGVIDNSPAAKELKAKWFILKVNDVSCRDKAIEDVVALIRGDIGSHVKITVADNKQGNNPEDHDLVRASMTIADPVTSFNAGLETELKQLKRQGNLIVKSYTSECGNYYFNFNAEAKVYYIRVHTLEEKGKPYKPGFEATATVYDNDNEATAFPLSKTPPFDGVDQQIATLEGSVTFKKECVGTISIKIRPLDDAAKCKGMYIIVYTPDKG